MNTFSARFQRNVRITRHAAQRMFERHIEKETILELIETGEVKWQDERRVWIYKNFPTRNDNLLCVAAVLENELVVKTVMIHWALVE